MFKILRNIDIESTLSQSSRQYLTGRLGRPQLLEHIDDEKIEIGITDYSTATSEAPHTHSQAYEYQLMLSGHTRYLDIDSNTEFEFKKGDFYVISPGVRYAQKSKQGTRILFIKVPPGNDKIDLDVSTEVEAWLESKIKTIRTDHFNNPEAPKPNSLKPAVAAGVFNTKTQKLLFVRRKDSGKWTLPGGVLEFGESLLQTVHREVKEETNLNVDISELVGTYSSPDILIEYNDGEVRQEFTLVYLATTEQTEVRLDHESKEYIWIDVDDAHTLTMADSQRVRIQDLAEYTRDKKTRLK
ncbi:NUDIX domain-containing protein [Vibrio hangzhouensis]|uniref:NUDIX domain-containing protein n=1 Tax=Vibrio hangzhouensis TaxID=462991 RepID=UPI001C967EBE|nr:NUDIX domain-containing protein [Vibrio hangzhouensis]MBY6199131.1 NUDIX domain-containing protein [Vibrio hangzhouensis]